MNYYVSLIENVIRPLFEKSKEFEKATIESYGLQAASSLYDRYAGKSDSGIPTDLPKEQVVVESFLKARENVVATVPRRV